MNFHDHMESKINNKNIYKLLSKTNFKHTFDYH